LSNWPLLTEKELSFLCGEGAAPPAGAVVVDWGAGLAYARA
jgi:hypothetical protein